MEDSAQKTVSRWWYILFIVPFIGVLWVPFYNSVEPTWQGIPFYYWYQFLWVIIGSVITAFIYLVTESKR